MNDAKHTPGPWKEALENDYVPPQVFAGDFGRPVADVFGESRETRKANARLFAAAPELLEALRRCVALMKNGFIPPENLGKDAEEIVSGDYANGWDAACEEFRNSRTAEIAQAAIDKAEGR